MLLQPSTAHSAITHVLPATDMSLQGGDKLTKVLADMTKGLEGEKVLSVGFLSGATYPDGTPVAAVAFWNEFGTIKSPPRPFFRTMIAEAAGTWPEILSKAVKYTEYDGSRALSIMGEKIKDDLRASITGWTAPANAPYTIKQKGFNKPLVDTGHMMNSIGYEVNDGS